jgi:hypothetical protein
MVMVDAPRPMPEHIRAALVRARANPMPPGPERDRLVADAVEALRSDRSTWVSTEEFLTELEAMRPHAAE